MRKENCYLNEISVEYQRKYIFKEQVKTNEDAERIAREIYRIDKCKMDLREYFYIILLSRSNNVIGYYRLSEGGLDCTVSDARLAFATALKCAASQMLMVHNHPSGMLSPSDTDRVLTKRFEKIGELLQIKIMDHLILTSEGSFSFRYDGFFD